MAVALVVLGCIVVGALVLYGARRMVRGDREKVVVLSHLVGQEVTLWITVKNLFARHCVILRVGHGNVVVRDRDNEERVYPVASVQRIEQGDHRWGPW